MPALHFQCIQSIPRKQPIYRWQFLLFYTADQNEFSSLNTNILSLSAYPQYGWFLSDRWAFAILTGVNWTRSTTLTSQSFSTFEDGVTPIILNQINNGTFRVSIGQRFDTRTQIETNLRFMPSMRNYEMFSKRIGLISEVGIPINYCIISYANRNRDNDVSSTGLGGGQNFPSDFHQLNFALTFIPRLLFMLNDNWGLEAAIGSINVSYSLDKVGDNSFRADRFTANANLTQRFNLGIRYYFTPSNL